MRLNALVMRGLALAGLLLSLATRADPVAPFLVVLGIAQDAGVPQTGSDQHLAWDNRGLRRMATSLGVVGPSGERWLFDATPDFREQLHALNAIEPVRDRKAPDGIFLTHAHIGHYTGLMFLGHESMGAEGTPVYVMPRMAAFLKRNGPWDQLVRYGNIDVRILRAKEAVALDNGLSVTPFPVPHRQEYSEVVGFRIEGPTHDVVFIPDIDAWETWDAQGTRLEDVIVDADRVYLDGTFFADGEIPGRDMTGFPHPRIRATVLRLESMPETHRDKVRFIHLNHSNPALYDSPARDFVESRGFHVAEEGETYGL